ncbi:MAG TPA: SRPBCC family protein [Terriglobales bacterium]|nr:SRPBCC family protein [Terriglobales bacterium]
MATQQHRGDAHARWRPGRVINGASATAALDERLAKGLGWFSLGLGLAEAVAPRVVARVAGVPERRTLLRTYGAREIASGIGILSERRPVGWLWSRVVGDVLDLASLAAAMTSSRSRRGRVLAATAAVAGVTALDVLCARRLRARVDADGDQSDAVRVRTSITILRSPDDVYRFWRDFTNLARVMRHVESVQVHGERRSHWVARAAGGTRYEWDAELVEDRRGELITWRSLPGGDVETYGSVRFVPAPAGRGTEVHLDMEYRVTAAGLLGGAVARLRGGGASSLVAEDLRPLKQVLETGEVPTTDGSPSARVRDAVRGGRA